jgi:hypothetical protein
MGKDILYLRLLYILLLLPRIEALTFSGIIL